MSSGVSAKRPATYEDVLAAPEHLIAEILDGELHLSPRPAIPHARTTTGLSADLVAPFDYGRGGPGGWWILVEPELHLGKDILVPDLAGWRRSGLPKMPRGAFFEMAPDWICETISPSTERIDRGKKQRIYAREGVQYLWFANPKVETLEVYRLEQGRWSLLNTHVGDVKAGIEPFEAVELELWRLWGQDAPRGGDASAP